MTTKVWVEVERLTEVSDRETLLVLVDVPLSVHSAKEIIDLARKQSIIKQSQAAKHFEGIKSFLTTYNVKNFYLREEGEDLPADCPITAEELKDILDGIDKGTD